MSRFARHIEENVVVLPIFKYDGSKKELASTSLMATDPHKDLSQEPRTEEEVNVFEMREPVRESLVESPMDVHRVSPPPVDIASQLDEAGDSKEMDAPRKRNQVKKPRRVTLWILPWVNHHLSNQLQYQMRWWLNKNGWSYVNNEGCL